MVPLPFFHRQRLCKNVRNESSEGLSLYHDDKYETPSSGVDVLVFFVLDDHMLFFQKKRPVVSRAAPSRVAEKQVQMN